MAPLIGSFVWIVGLISAMALLFKPTRPLFSQHVEAFSCNRNSSAGAGFRQGKGAAELFQSTTKRFREQKCTLFVLVVSADAGNLSLSS
ncbi:hypothetical protein JZX86_09935 [Agrobacterium rosae]|uniref:hypothetical protein n=1 Tax=Agrobacterium rosae TaxID=1972867 RepID=UPI0019D3ACDE|nr:hypothetical protein [Agrobacterium rosae]MBN7805682.1 hypothetical protein [Agrobacterium rosae]